MACNSLFRPAFLYQGARFAEIARIEGLSRPRQCVMQQRWHTLTNKVPSYPRITVDAQIVNRSTPKVNDWCTQRLAIPLRVLLPMITVSAGP